MIYNGDDNRHILSDDSLEHNGNGSNDEEIADDIPAQRELDNSDSGIEQRT